MSIFEETQSIQTRIQQILRDYPYGNAVLLELLQNADDAEATRAMAVLETFVANTDNSAARSPALLFYNSATFTDRDLKNIQCIGGSDDASKRDDGTKVGRFGIGFRSVYHVGDVVAFVTGDLLVVLDPARANLPPDASGIRTGGFSFHIPTFHSEHTYTTSEQKDFVNTVLTAFENSGLGYERHQLPFKGTIFRIPLRDRPTDFWKEVHSPREIARLMVEYFSAATLGMLMMKNLTEVRASLHRKGPSHPLDELFNVCATPAIQFVFRNRKTQNCLGQLLPIK